MHVCIVEFGNKVVKAKKNTEQSILFRENVQSHITSFKSKTTKGSTINDDAVII